MHEVDDYLAGRDEPARSALAHVRDIALDEVPDAEQGKGYGMPALLHDGRPFLSMMQAKKHLAIYPFSGRVVDEVRGDLDGFSLSSGTIRFTAEHPVPEEIIRRVIRLRVAEIEAGRR